MRVAIIILTHNRADKLKKLLQTISNSTKEAHSIYILDNGSTLEYNTFNEIDDKYDLNFFRSTDNWYPSKARNYLFSKLENEEFVVTLDDDMMVTDGWLTELLKLVQTSDKCAGVSPRILQENKNKIHSQGGFYTISDNYFIIFQEYYRMQTPQRNENSVLKCDWLASGCSLYPRKIIDEFRYDENMPCMEDPLHSYEIKKAGYDLYSTSKSVVIHSAGKTANVAMRSNDNLIKGICYFHQKTGLNPIKSWSMHTRLMRGKTITHETIDLWLHYNKVKLSMVNGNLHDIKTKMNNANRHIKPINSTPANFNRKVKSKPAIEVDMKHLPLSQRRNPKAAYKPGSNSINDRPRKKPFPARYEYLKRNQ